MGELVCLYLRLMMKTAAVISSKIPTPLTDRSKKAEFTPSPIRGKGSDGGETQKSAITKPLIAQH